MIMIVCPGCRKLVEHYAKGFCHKCYQREINNPRNREKTHEYYLRNRNKIRTQKHQNYERNREKMLIQKRDHYHNGNSSTVFLDRVGKKLYLRCGNGKRLHRVIAERVLGRRLKSHEVVHHIDGNGLNNEHSNLLICTRSYHKYLHGNNQGGKT